MRLGEVGCRLAQHFVFHLEFPDAFERLGHLLAFISVSGLCHSVGLVAGVANSGLQCCFRDAQICGDLLLGHS